VTVFFKDDDFQFGVEEVLGSSYRQAADVGEVLSTVGRIRDGDADSWVTEWTATAGAVWAAGQQADTAGRPTSALAHYRRAATYYATALNRVAHATELEPGRELDLWRRQRECWDRTVDRMPVPGERVTVPYEDTALPAYFFRAPDSDPQERRPLVIVNSGGDGATSQAWVHGGAAASERGYHWMTFDGPGQQAALYEQAIPCRPDWEAVLSPVLDAVWQRPDVDANRIAAIGVSQAGYWITRALAFEHRLTAAVIDPGVLDLSAPWLSWLPEVMLSQLRHRQHAAFDREMQLVELFSSATAAKLRCRGKPYGLNGGSRFALYESVSAYRLGDEIQQITTPLLITDSDREQFWPGQSQQLYDRLPGPRQLLRFTSAEGASRHCEPRARAPRDTRIFDWLDSHLA
jgi:hypothetical protein